MNLNTIHWIYLHTKAKLIEQNTPEVHLMETTSIRLPIRNLPEQFDRTRIAVVLDEIEMALMDDGGVYASTSADSFTITDEVPTNQLVDATACLKDLQLI